MAYLRLIYRSWSAFWTFIGVLISTVLLLVATLLGALQLDPVQELITDKMESSFHDQFSGRISIGDVGGFLPFRASLENVRIYADSTDGRPAADLPELEVSADLMALLNGRLIVNGLRLHKPILRFDALEGPSLAEAFRPISSGDNDMSDVQPDSLGSTPNRLNDILIPSMVIDSGKVLITREFNTEALAIEGNQLTLDLSRLVAYFEFSPGQRILDIEDLQFSVPELQLQRANVLGQIYNDEQVLEFNSFSLNLARSRVVFNSSADGVDLTAGQIAEQLSGAYYELNISEANLNPENLNRVFPSFPKMDRSIQAVVEAEGDLDSLWFANIESYLGESVLLARGSLLDLRSGSGLSYDLNIDEAALESSDVATFAPDLDSLQINAISDISYRGALSGDLTFAEADLWLTSQRGSVHLFGSAGLDPLRDMDLTMIADSLDLGGIIAAEISDTDIYLNARVQSKSTDIFRTEGMLDIRTAGRINDLRYDSLKVDLGMDQGLITSDFNGGIYGALITGSGQADLRSNQYTYRFDGSAESLPIKQVTGLNGLRDAILDLNYGFNITGNDPDQLNGSVNMDVISARIGEEVIDRHQLYFDLLDNPQGDKEFRFTSTAFDANLKGQYNPTEMLQLFRHWKDFFRYRYRDEILLEQPAFALTDTLGSSTQDFNWTIDLKDLELLRSYYPDFPEIRSSFRLAGAANVSPERMSFNANITDPLFNSGQITADSLLLRASGGFRYDSRIKDFSRLEMSGVLGLFEYDLLSARDFTFNAELRQDSLRIRSDIKRLADNAEFHFQGEGVLSDSLIRLGINELRIGTKDYTWLRQGQPVALYDRDNRLRLNDFNFSSGEQYIGINGVFSAEPEDSVNYRIDGVELQRLSDVINGRINFSGLLNGNFTTRSLTRIPSIQGDISIERFMLNDQIAGDLRLNSTYNQDLDRFDTRITVLTDSSKYPAYFENNDRRGLDFEIDGYVRAPGSIEELSANDSLYAFDVNFRNIDMWILPFIGPKVFNEASGQGNGRGTFWGSAEDYDFDVQFEVGLSDAVYFRPKFLDTYYYAQGPINFNRTEGLRFDDVFVIDPSGGLATLSGTFDFNDFQPVNYFDLRVEMDEFQFLNSDFAPTLPFYGEAYGSSTVTITGTNLNPVMRTLTPMQISDFSEIGIPLVEETEVGQENKLIRFVDSFDLAEDSTGGGSSGIPGQGDVDPADLTFAERFTLDLVFEASDPMTVRLVFDPVTNDAVTANGTGRMQIRLEDQQVSMFGRFDITDGRYNFVSGDIFSRRFQLEPGGSIVWEGAPDNARLNLNAFYRARPDINTLTATRGSLQDQDAQQIRVPVELVLSITGTLNSIENEFFFRLPDTFDPNTNATLTTQLAAINRDQDAKLIQATSFLLVGEFIPVSNSTTGGNPAFANNFSGSAAVLNPLLSNQVISPLLSSQINSLLNSDVSSLDVDFNLNTYNQVDLGVALRLYNDKLILRREGQVYAQNNINIGDIGATYRINRTFSVTAFHRQDPTFGNLNTTNSTNDTQDINGVGVEARFSFNTWKEFFNRLGRPFRKLFGIKDKKEEEITENRE